MTYWYTPRCTYKQQHRRHLWYHKQVPNSCPQMYTLCMKQLQARGVTYFTQCRLNCNPSQYVSQRSRPPNLCPLNCQLNFQTHYQKTSTGQVSKSTRLWPWLPLHPLLSDPWHWQVFTTELFTSHMTWDLIKSEQQILTKLTPCNLMLTYGKVKPNAPLN